MNVIFLDIDGVLNSIDSMVASYQLGLHSQEKTLDIVSIGLLMKLCKETNAKIVISSTWRLGRTIDDFKSIFSHYGWSDFPIVGMTGRGGIGSVRGDEIQEWVDSNDVSNYVILDDDSDMLESQKLHFVHVSGVNGFRLKHLCHALHIFGFPSKDLEAHAFFAEQKNYV